MDVCKPYAYENRLIKRNVKLDRQIDKVLGNKCKPFESDFIKFWGITFLIEISRQILDAYFYRYKMIRDNQYKSSNKSVR